MKTPITTLASLLLFTAAAPAQTQPSLTAFTYQGRLDDAGQPANGTYDLQFGLRDAATGGAGGAPLIIEDVAVQNGLFTVTLDFGEKAFSEGARWLEIGVRPGSTASDFTVLSPRQAVTAAPLALHALKADTAATALTALSAASALSADTAASATKASSADSVAWNHVAGLPAGFADGADNDTTYTAGPGLSLNGTQFALNFSGSGTLNAAARGDHSHFGSVWSGASGGAGLSLTNTSAAGTAGLFRQGNGSGYVPFGGSTAGLWGDAHDGPGIFGTGTGTSPGVLGMVIGNSVGATGVTGISDASSGRGVFGHATFTNGAFGSSYGVVGECESPSGAGVKAIGANTSSPALEIQNGGIKVSGAGVNSPTPAFVHEATATTLTGAHEYSWGTVYRGSIIDHPLCNNKPAAILTVTRRVDNISTDYDCDGFIYVKYLADLGRWCIQVAPDGQEGGIYWAQISPSARFNVLVVNP